MVKALVRVRAIITIRNYNYMSTSLAWLNFNMCYGVIFTSSKCIIYLDYLHQPHSQQSQNSLV